MFSIFGIIVATGITTLNFINLIKSCDDNWVLPAVGTLSGLVAMNIGG